MPRVVAPAREAAFQALRAVSSERVDLGAALSRARDPLTDVRDRALATDLVIGTLRWRGTIDYQLQRLSAQPLQRLDADVLDALRVAGYQILYLTRVPVSAVVNDTVHLVKAAGFRSAAGFANAVLRRLSRERDTLTWPERPPATHSLADRRAMIDHLAVRYSHPAWLVERWIDRHGVETTEAWLQFNNHPPAITIATNRFRGTRDELAARLKTEGVETVPTRAAPYGLTVTDGRVLSSTAFTDGLFVVQDEASQIVAELVEAAAGDRVFDACASPGGKTIALAAQSTPSGIVIAADVRPRRVRLLAETIRRCGIVDVRVVQTSDAHDLPFRTAVFDRVLVDAPCSGLGTVRRDPDIRWRRRAEDFPSLAAAQRDLLSRVAPHVAAGGRLVYSTCSSEPEENEQVVEAFLGGTSEFRLVPLSTVVQIPDAIRAMATPEGYLRTTPVFGLEAFFGAIFVRSGA